MISFSVIPITYKLYTFSHKEENIDSATKDQRFTADEHAMVVKKEIGSYFQNKWEVIGYYLYSDHTKLKALSFLINFLKENQDINVALSIGSGSMWLEYLLSLAFPQKKIIATEFDPFLIEKATQNFPEIFPSKFDVIQDKIIDLSLFIGCPFDLVFSFGSFYVMDDDEFINFLKSCKKAEVKYIIDFHAGHISGFSQIKYMIKNVIPSRFISKTHPTGGGEISWIC